MINLFASRRLPGHLVRLSTLLSISIALCYCVLQGCSNNIAAPASVATSGVIRGDNIQAVASNGSVAVASNGSNSMLVSMDFGKVWTRIELSQNVASIIDIATCPNGKFFALDFYHRVWRGDSHGQVWSESNLPATFNPLALTCRQDGMLWVVGSETSIAFSDNDGDTWTAQSLNEDAMLRSVQFFDALHGVVLGEFGMVATTRDGGKTWKKYETLGKDFYPYSAYFEDSRSGWVAGIAGVIKHTTDGGATWTEQINSSGASVYALVRHQGHMLGVGDGGRIIALKGNEWKPLTESISGTPYLMSAVDLGDKGVLVAGPNAVLTTVYPPVDSGLQQ